MANLEEFMRGLTRRNPGEEEFHQAVREVGGIAHPIPARPSKVHRRRNPGADDRA